MKKVMNMNNKGGMNDVVGALVGLLIAGMTLYVVMVVWDPLMNLMLFPLLSNAEAFPYGGAAITLLGVFVLVAVVMIFLAFFNEASGRDRQAPPMGY